MKPSSVPGTVTAVPHPVPSRLSDTHEFRESGRFLALGDGVVRRLLDVQLRLDTIRDVLDSSNSTSAQVQAARGDLTALVAGLEAHLRVSNAAMLDITSGWPNSARGR